MRALPIALAYPSPDAILKTSARVSALTHWDPQAEVCCAIYCAWIHALLHGADRGAAWHTALAAVQTTVQNGKLAPDTVGPGPLPAGFWQRLASVEQKCYTDLQPTGYAGYVVDCLEAAVWCCLKADSLERAIVLAVNLDDGRRHVPAPRPTLAIPRRATADPSDALCHRDAAIGRRRRRRGPLPPHGVRIARAGVGRWDDRRRAPTHCAHRTAGRAGRPGVFRRCCGGPASGSRRRHVVAGLHRTH